MTDQPAGWGVAIALSILAAWGLSLFALLASALTAPSDLLWALPAAAIQTFFCTGLFITAHDAMHGTVTPGNSRLNDTIGAVAVALYALFSFKRLRYHHGFHHGHPGDSERDPDFHDGEHTDPVRWYFRFMRRYLSIWQVVGMALIFNVLLHVFSIPLANLMLFWVGPALMSTVQLFYFGTYLPHRRSAGDGDPHHAISSSYPVWLSFVTCYHFGYHAEHHEHPQVPWWQLPHVRWRPAAEISP